MAELTPTEQDFASTLETALNAFGTVQEKARAVVASGGDCRTAFLSVFDDEEYRAQAAMQWPILSMLLGV